MGVAGRNFLRRFSRISLQQRIFLVVIAVFVISTATETFFIQRFFQRYVVVFNMDTMRYSHPLEDRLGQRFVGGDEQEALKGKTYISQALGTLGLSIRAFVPVWNTDGRQIGVVSVGLLVQDLDRESRRIGAILATAALLSLAVGLLGAILLSRSSKRKGR